MHRAARTMRKDSAVPVLLMLFICLSVEGAHNSLTDRIRYLQDLKYVYKFDSNATVGPDIHMELTAEVAITVVAESDDWQNLHVTLDSPSITWYTSKGAFTDQGTFTNEIEWFIIHQFSNGEIASVTYPEGTTHPVAALKKSVAKMLSFSTKSKDVEKKTYHNGISTTLSYEEKEEAFNKHVTKDILIGRNGQLMSIDLNEEITPSTGGASSILSAQMSSHSTLVLLETEEHPFQEEDHHDEEKVVTEPLTVTPPMTPLDTVRPRIIELLSCAESQLTCRQEFVATLKQLSNKDLQLFASSMLKQTNWSPSAIEQSLMFIDALVKLSTLEGTSTILVDNVLNADNIPASLTRRVLFHFTTFLIPTENAVKAIMSLVESVNTDEDIREKALLALGSMSRFTRDKNPSLSSNITQFIHHLLENHMEGDAPGPQSCKLITIINSLGNAADNTSKDILKEHASGAGKQTDLRAQLAAIRAMAQHYNLEAATTLKEIAQTSSHPLVQHASASAYMKHPNASTDLSHLLKKRSMPERSRRSTDEVPKSLQYNVTMPSVNWGLSFGDDNITVDITRNILNSFDILNDPFSTEYLFSMRDEAIFSSRLSVSSGEQHNDFLQTELCLEGTVTYDTNMATDYSHLQIVKQFNELQSEFNSLSDKFHLAYDSITKSEVLYDSINSEFSSALDSVKSQLQVSSQRLKQFLAISQDTLNGSKLKEEAIDIAAKINSSFTNAYQALEESREGLVSTLSSVMPSKLDAFLSSLIRNDQPFTLQSELVPYLKYAPKAALAGIYDVYWESGNKLSQLETDVKSFLQLTSKYGLYSNWTHPFLNIWSAEGNIEDLLVEIELEKENAIDDGKDVSELQALSEAISDHLKPALNTLIESAHDVHVTRDKLQLALKSTLNGYDEFTEGYESSRSTVDKIFGQRFYPSFPAKLRSCDSAIGCGSYPTTSGDRFRDGIDLLVKESSDPVTAPFAGYISLFDPTSLDNPIAYNYSSANTVLLTPTEFSLDSYYFIIANVAPHKTVTSSPTFVYAGQSIGTAMKLSGGQSGVHVEAYKTLSNKTYTVDPTQFVSPVLSPTATVDWECNEVTTVVNGMVVDTQTVVKSSPVKELIGEPLVTINIPDEEFPQPYDMILDHGVEVSPGENVEFFQSSTFLMVGVIPVTFSFSSYGQYSINMSLYAALLSGAIDVSVTPEVWGRVEGYVKVGSAIYATVNMQGALLNASLPLTLNQNSGNWPLSASSSMDLVLHPTALNLTTQLVQRVGVGDLAIEELLESEILWSYEIPDVNQEDEFYYIGTYKDATPPLFTPLLHSDGSECYVRQLSGRDYTNPAFELEFDITEEEGLSQVQFMVGTYENGDNVFSTATMQGQRIVIPHNLLPDKDLTATVSAVNRNGLKSYVHCILTDYDLSPPQARVVPFSDTTSHPNKFEVLLVLFDEYGLTETMEVAVGTTAGEEGSDLLDWTTLDTNLINQVPSDEKFSFARSGRFIESVISLETEIEEEDECASLCEEHSDCLSYDFSDSQKRCILHSAVEGPVTADNADFVNTFETLPLQISQDFVHREALGKGYSTSYTLTGLSLKHRQTFYINLRLYNNLGYTSLISSESVLVDLTAPTPGRVRNSEESLERKDCGADFNKRHECKGETTPINNHRVIIDGSGSATVFNGPTPLYDALYTKANNFMAANWDGIEDRESGLLAYTWCISLSAEHNCDVLEQSDPVSELAQNGLAKFTGSDALKDGNYYITVDAVNKAGYGGALVTTIHHSIPFIVDTTPPDIEYLEIDDYEIESNILTFNYSISDSGSGIKEVSISVGTTADNTEILPWTVIDNENFQWTTSSVSVTVPDGINGWVKLRAINNVNLKTIITSEVPVLVDRTPPTKGTLNDGPHKGSNLQYQSNKSVICANWEGVSDPHSGISLFQWAVGTSPNDYNTVALQNLTDEEVAVNSVCLAASLTHGIEYYSTLLITNGADPPLTTTTTSDGVLIDTSAPDGGTVLDGSSTDIDYSHSLTTVSASWSGFSDAESGIDKYIIRVYRTPAQSLDSMLILTKSVTDTSYYGNHFDFANGDSIKVTVEAFNGAGLSSLESSDGYLIDLTAPQVTSLHDGQDPSSDDVEYLASGDSYPVSWKAFDDESGISTIEIALFQMSEGKKIRIFPDPLSAEETEILEDPMTTSYNIKDLDLTQNHKYIATVTFTNGAGLKSSFDSNGVYVDLIAPTVESVTVLGDTYLTDEDSLMLGNSKQVEARWEGSDDGSGISEYLVAVVNEDDAILNTGGDYINFGAAENGRISQLNLMVGTEVAGPFYRVKVLAKDRAGNMSVAAYSEKFWISGEDYAGTVYDGYYPFDDVDYTDEMSSISTYFSGFFSQQCGGVVQYQWAVGEGYDDKTSVLPYTEMGVVVLGNGSGYAQLLFPDIRDHQSEQLFITVRGVTGCGEILESTSNGFVADITPPSVSILGTGHKALEDASANTTYQTDKTFSSTWTVSEDSGENIDHVTVSIGTYPGGNDLMNATEVETDHIREKIAAPEGVPSFVTVTAKNAAGLESVVYSDPVVLDVSPPETGYIECSHSNDAEAQISCSWENVTDPESGIDYFLVSVAEDELDKTRITSAQASSSACSVSFDVMEYSNSKPYYITLHAYNRVGLESVTRSGPVFFDSSPPINQGTLYVSPNFGEFSYEYNIDDGVNVTSEAFCLWHTNVLTLRFSCSSDDESGIREYQLGVGQDSGGDDILKFHTIDVEIKDSEWATYTLQSFDIDSQSRHPYYFTIRTFDNVGLYSDITSRPVYIKSDDNALPSWVYDGDGTTSADDRDYQVSTTHVSGRAFFGVNCPMKTLEWSIVGIDGLAMKNFTELELEVPKYLTNNYEFETDQVMLYDDETYQLIVRGIDYTGQVHVIKSDGFVVTTRPLLPGFVSEGLEDLQELNYQESVSTLPINFGNFGDGTDEQEIEYFEVALGSDKELLTTRSDIVPFTRVGLANTHSFTGLNLVPLSQTYYATVRAHAISGAVAEVTSDGIVVGLTHSMKPGNIVQTPYQSNTTFLSAYWTGFESEVPITKYEWALGTRVLNYSILLSMCNDRTDVHESEFEVFAFDNLDTGTYGIARDLNLKHGLKYYVTIRVTDQSDKCIVISSTTPTVIDTTVPNASNTTIGPQESRVNLEVENEYVAYVLKGNSLTVSWNDFTDLESGIKTYEAGLFRVKECAFDIVTGGETVVEYEDIGLVNSFTFEDLDLTPNVSYVARIRATNHAGLKAVVGSNPVLVDSQTFLAGEVKDGTNWEIDHVFQSDLTKLSGVFTLSYFQRKENGSYLDSPCPTDKFYPLNSEEDNWSKIVPHNFNGLKSSTLRYETSTVDFSSKNGMTINAEQDPTGKQLVSGGYSTPLSDMTGRKSVSLTVHPALGDSRLQKHTVTSVLFLETTDSDLLVEYDPSVPSESSSSYKALGLQIHTQGSTTDQQTLILWSRDESELSIEKTVSQELTLNITKSLDIHFQFTYEEIGLVASRKVEVFINDVLTLALHDVPFFTTSGKLILHMFNREGYLPECVGECASDPPKISASFSDVSLPSETNNTCSYGLPFHSWGSPVVEFKAGIGTAPYQSDIKPLEVIYSPCRPCSPTPCHLYGCDSTCPTSGDPQEVSFSFGHLSLLPYLNDSQYSSSGSGSSGDDDNDEIEAKNEFDGFFTPKLNPAVYYVTVEATTASGQTVSATSNGVLIDITPPSLSVPINLYDVEFSQTQSSMYQGNNHTISASWGFKDLQSGITKYEWSIGTTPYGQDIQPFTSIGLNTHATNSELEGQLYHNRTYYVTVRATNGAGLYTDVTSSGITHLSIELNETAIDESVLIESSRIIDMGKDRTLYVVKDEEFGLIIISRTEGVSDTKWAIGSHLEPGTVYDDIFPLTDINDGESASVDTYLFYIDGLPYSNVSDILALADGVNPSDIEGLYIEPGRVFYHILEFCNLAHSCVLSNPRESILIRLMDASVQSPTGKDINITINQQTPYAMNQSVLNQNYSVTVRTSGGLQVGTVVFAGFLSEEDVTRTYRVDTPYISNPYDTMDRTSRELARRFSSIGGPSFFVSFYGQETLEGELLINTSFSSTVDWSESDPKLAYWDIDNMEWREVEDTCGSQTAVNWTLHTLSVEVCSTIVDGVDIDSRPSSLSRRRRNIETESGSGTDEEFLERPVQFIVIERGNVSLNTPPTLDLDTVVIVNEDKTLSYQIPYTDREEDQVLFYLTSVPRLGTATVNPSSGVLTYTPCENCFGNEYLDLYIKETNLKFGEELDAKGTLQLSIMNTDDPLSSFLFQSTSENDISVWPNRTIDVYLEANRSKPITVARVGVYDYDGYEDDMEIYVTNPERGSAEYETWLDVVAVPESLPVDWSGHELDNFTGYVTFVGADITYLPSDPGFTGVDTISVYSQQEDKITTPFLVINVEVIPSVCLNNGVCKGSPNDPNCSNITNRKANPGEYNCSCLTGYSGLYCQVSSIEPSVEIGPECPGNIPKMTCIGNPCDNAVCPGYRDNATCVPDYCGHCVAVWYKGDEVVRCSASDKNICFKPVDAIIELNLDNCDDVVCDCPSQPYECPDDSVFIETRINECCVTYTCQCPDISCPVLMDSSKEVMPLPEYRGGKYPARCCPKYRFEDINECLDPDLNTCSHYCANAEPLYSCTCDEGVTLASDGETCGVCTYDGVEYFYGDRVKIGCNWCICQGDTLSGERWHCTARSCDPTCYYNGLSYPLDSQLALSSLACSCNATDAFAEWNCEFGL